jgi:hypothetical protein
MTQHSHLLDKASELINSSKEERIEYVNRDKWIGYPRAQKIIDQLEDLMVYPKSDRMPNLLIIGDSNNGKTKILRKFEDRYPLDIDEDTCLNIQPVVFISAPSKPDENAFYIRLLQKLYVPFAKNDSTAIKREKVIRIMEIRKTRMIIIDEIHHLIAGSYNSHRSFLNSIKDLSNALRIPIIGAGIEDAFHAIQVDPQLANRFKVEVLERWNFNALEKRKEFAQLIASIETRLPLSEPSFLYKSPYVEKIHYLSDGLIGEAVGVIKQLAIYAIKHDLPCIDDSVFSALNLLPPSKRKELLKHMR